MTQSNLKMRKLINFLIEKNKYITKLSVVFFLTFLSFSYTIAQTTCGCENPVRTLKHLYFTTRCNTSIICYDANGNVISPTITAIPDPITNQCICGGPDEWVQIDYYQIVCPNGDTIIEIIRSFGVDAGYSSNPTLDIHANFKNRLTEAFNYYGLSTGGGSLTILYPKGCMALSKVTYPPGTKCYYPMPEGPSTLVEYNYDNDRTVESFPCAGSNCCTLDYVWNAAQKRYLYVSPNAEIICPGPTPNITTTTLTCNDINGNPQTYSGTVNFVADCKSYCDQTMNTQFRTSNTKNFEPFPDPFNVSISPVPANESITFSEIKNIRKIEIYDATGKKQLEQTTFDKSTINITTLSKGVHFVRVYFTEAGIRTIKIIKQ